MPAKLTWRGPQILAKVEAELGRRIDACLRLVANHAKRRVGIEGAGKPPEKGGRLKYGANASAPGESPHKQTGRLQASITTERTGLSGRVGTNLLYGLWLELGTRLMAARPWLLRSLDECRAAIDAILSRPMN